MPRDVMTPSLDAARKVAEGLVATLWRDRVGYADAINVATEAIAAHVRAVVEEMRQGLANEQETVRALRAEQQRLRGALLRWKRRDIDGAPCFCAIEPIPEPAPKLREHESYCAVARAALAEREREILAWKAGVLCHRCDQAVNEPGIFFHDRCLADYVEGVSFLEVAEKTDALSAGGERLRELLRHEIYRNHEHTDACDACKGSDAALALGAERGREEKG